MDSSLIPKRSPQLTKLLEAAQTCSLEPVKRFLAAGGEPDALVELPFDDGTLVLAPLIRRAIMTHQIAQDPAMHHASLELLLQAGAKVNALCKDANGLEHTSLMAACRGSCCIAPVRILLAHGADPALQTSTGCTALHIAARAGRLECCKLLPQTAGCEPDLPNFKGFTPLALAVLEGHMQVIELLHKQWRADIFIRVPSGATMLHVAADTDQTLVLEYLLRNGLDVNATNGEVLTAVMIAAKRGNTAAVQMLLEHGASTLIAHSRGRNLLMIAVEAGQAGVVELLLRLHTVDVNAASVDGHTALHIAASKDCTAAAALLLQYGAAVNTTAVNGATPLLLAAANASAEFVQLLLDAGALADVTANAYVVHAAVKNSKRPEVLQLLLKHSQAAVVLDNFALQCSCCGPRSAVMHCRQPAHMKLLLAAGADVHMTTVRGNTALHVAAAHKHPAPVLCLLIKAGVDLHAVNSGGKTAAQVAADTGNTLAAALLTRAARDA
eukprot:19119-Heterococcus_DN1.PRE.4